MKALVIGGGIAGLTAAIALQQARITVEVHEAASHLRPVGAGISLAANAMGALKELGLTDQLLTEGAEASQILICDERLRPIQTMEGVAFKERYGNQMLMIHRARLQKVLLEALDPTTLHLGRRLLHIEQQERQVIAHFSDGSVASGDLLVGADGIHSAVRTQLFPASRTRYAGQTCWRGICHFELPDTGRSIQFESWGGRRRFGCTPIGHGEIYWFAVETIKAGGQDTVPDLPAWLASQFGDFAAPVPELIRSTPTGNIIRGDLYDLRPMERWHLGRCLLIGDAAHATTPNLGQGGGQAIEDAYHLGRLLRPHPAPEEVFRRFEALRRPKVNRVVRQSRLFGRMAHAVWGRSIRNWILRRIPAEMALKQMDWLYTLDE